MNNIFNRKIIFQRDKRINFNNSLYKKIEHQIYGELLDYFLIFNNSEQIKNILLLNNKNNFLEKELFEYFLKKQNNIKNIQFNNFNFVENDKSNFDYLHNSCKNNLIIGVNSFHNVNYLEKYLFCIKNNLEDGGIFCGNFFGNNNLSKLKKIIIKNDSIFSKNIYPRFNPTISPESVYCVLQKTNFKNITLIPEKINYHFNSKNSFAEAMNFLKNTNERNYLIDAQKNIPNRRVFLENIPLQITLDFEVIRFYCHK
ncbi:MAG: hypothetical protein ACI9CD_000664 [Candidatus Deianiraeaceae bacterium]|jgi:hypothetical protein